MFYNNQTEQQKSKYKEYLKGIGALSRLFSENSDTYIDSRIAENLFCKAFEARNSARDDSTADAFKDSVGIGIKTFIEKSKQQKIAEFNAIRHTYCDKSPREAVKIIAEARNERIRITKEIYGLTALVYHCVTRSNSTINIYESEMMPIHVSSIGNIIDSKSSIKFEDCYNKYSFNKSKSVLQMTFKLENRVESIETSIIDDPVDSLIEFIRNIASVEPVSSLVWGENAIYLPLYAPSSPDFIPAEKSGLNQWNAGGRKRHPDEVYIPVPSWIHSKFEDFFPQSRDISFNLKLPNDIPLSAKMCQEGLKGLMSNPNKTLGHWLLRDVLQLPEGTLVTRDLLDKIDIDSVLVIKTDSNNYKIDFDAVGKYEQFKEQFKS